MKPLAIRFQQRLDPFPHGCRFPCEFRPQGGAHATGSRRIRMAHAQIALDDGPQSLGSEKSGSDLGPISWPKSLLKDQERAVSTAKFVEASQNLANCQK